jgi:hypothetical protein
VCVHGPCLRRSRLLDDREGLAISVEQRHPRVAARGTSKRVRIRCSSTSASTDRLS